MKSWLFLLSVLLLYSCNQGPQPINYGKDDCSACKMTILDKKYGTELVSIKGKIYKFDDMICMIQFLNSGVISEKEVSKKLVVDFQNENNFIEVEKATFFVSNQLHSPMNGNTAAFINKEEALKYKDGKQGVIMDWDQVYNKLK